jgi:hypothetical protein
MVFPQFNQDAALSDICGTVICHWDDTDVEDAVTEHVICSICEKLRLRLRHLSDNDQKVLTLDNRLPLCHLKTLRELQASYKTGCHLCAILWAVTHTTRVAFQKRVANEQSSADLLDASVKYEAKRWSTDPAPIRIITELRLKLGAGETLHSSTLGGMSIQRWPHSVKVAAATTSSEVYLSDPDPNLSLHAAQLSITTASTATIDLAKRWLNECLHQHPACARVADSSKWRLPRRFINVTDGGLRVCDTVNLSEANPRYVSLSHCWGKKPIIRLLQSNLDQLYRRIDFADLSKTFQDSVILTRRLGYSYIWIDSLCIIQDSSDDWAHESTIMGDVYRNSVFTISALGAKDGSEGCFRRRNPLRTRPCFLGTDGNQSIYAHRHDLSVREWGDRPYSVVDNRFPETEEVEEVGYLHRRAWVFQERVLAPRTLHFGKSTIAWQCLEQEATEANPAGLYDKRFLSLLSSHKTSIWMLERLTSEHQYRKFLEVWANLRLAYTSSSLTYHEDRLVAMLGLFNVIQSRMGFTFVAGLWRDFLLQELVWYTVGTSQISRSMIRKPTWSWVSFDGTVGALYTGTTIRETGSNMLLIREMTDLEFATEEWVAEVVHVHAHHVVGAKAWDEQFPSSLLVLRGRARRVGLDVFEAMNMGSKNRSVYGCHTMDFSYFSPPPDDKVELHALPIVVLRKCEAAPSVKYEYGLIIEGIVAEKEVTWWRIGSYRKRFENSDDESFFRSTLGEETVFNLQ